MEMVDSGYDETDKSIRSISRQKCECACIVVDVPDLLPVTARVSFRRSRLYQITQSHCLTWYPR